MCGINGVLAPTGRLGPEVVERMNRAQHHRGPDGSGSELIPAGAHECRLGSTRLAIIDLSPAGRMPMRDPETGSVIVYNGEVYNFPELRRGLEARGERFTSGTDTEVVLRLYRREGPRSVERLRGMYAFAIWDAPAGELFLARDRAGEKPLYVASPAGMFVFASELRGLLASGLVERALDPEALEVYLTNGFLVAPGTMVAGVTSLLPGEWMRVAADTSVLERSVYWRPPLGEGSSAAAGPETLRRLFHDAVRMRRMSDVPLGAFLSGGLDSAAMVATLAAGGGDVRTFSIGFPEAGFDESVPARRVAARFGTRHTERVIDEAGLAAWIPDGLAAFDQPSFDGLNTYLVSRAAREGGLTVALSGLGADELFGGYPFFRTVPAMSAIARMAMHLPRLGRRIGERLGRVAGPAKLLDLQEARDAAAHPVIVAYQVAQSLLPTWWRDRLIDPACRERRSDTAARIGLPAERLARLGTEVAGLEPEAAVSVLAWRLFLGERCLRDTDAMSMAVSLEVRAPFVDHELAGALFGVPARVRCQGAPDKPFEWRLFEPALGGAIERRPKQGFVIPAEKWFRRGETRELIAATLGDAELLRSIGLGAGPVSRLVDGFTGARARVPWSRVWALFVLADWCRRHAVTR